MAARCFASIGWWLSQFLKPCRSEKGDTMVLVVLMLPVIMGAAALAIDIGTLMVWQARAQVSADAATLAGAAFLPESPGVARQTAVSYAVANGVPVSDADITVSATNASNDTIVVQPNRTVAFGFARVLGINSGQVRASAKATVGSLAWHRGVMPWGLLDLNPNRDVFSFGYGNQVTLKLWDQNQAIDGNFQALSLVGPGADEYRDAISGDVQAYLALGSEISAVDTEPGGMVGPTRQGLNERIGSNSQSCSDPTLANPLPGGKYAVDFDSPRVVVVPVIDELARVGRNARVIGFSVFCIQSWQVHGGTLEVTGRFFNTTVPGGAWAPYQGSYGGNVVRLQR